MAAPVSIDHYALFDDVVAVAKKAHAATAGWRAICVRAQRTVGKKVVQPLSELDLGEEIPALSERVRAIARKAPSEIDTLVFGLFDGIDVDAPLDAKRGIDVDAPLDAKRGIDVDTPRDAAEPGRHADGASARREGAGVYTGFHLGGAAGFDPEARWLLRAPSWLPEDRFLKSASLDAIARAGVVARGEAKKAVAHALRFGAAALLSRFAAEGLPYRVVVTFDDGDFAEISEGGSLIVAASAPPPPAASSASTPPGPVAE